MKKSRFTDRTKWKIIIVLMVGMVVVALFLQAGILMYVNSKNLDKTSQMLLDQSISIIEKNQKNEIDLIRSMKEDYVIRARAVSYILESRLEAENDTEELQKIASLMSIDEIYLFDATGKIYSGTKPEYYGYSFDSGEQMEYFKPMLENKGLTMCQDITPNTSKLQIDGILLTMVDNRTNFAKEIAALLRDTYGSKIKIFGTEIPHSVRAKEISAEGKSIFAHDPGGKVAEGYRNLTKEVLKLEKQREKNRAGLGR